MNVFPSLVAYLACFVGAAALAADPAGIVVTGKAEIKAKPNRASLTFLASGSAELSSDAIIKFQDVAQRLQESLKQLDIQNVEVKSGSISLSEQAAAQNNAEPAQGATQPIEMARAVEVSLTAVEGMSEEDLLATISRILDAAKDAGAKPTQSARAAMIARMYGQQYSSEVALFIVDDATPLLDKAFAEAFASALERATKLANLAGVELGEVLAIEEQDVSTGEEKKDAMPWYYANVETKSTTVEGKRLTSKELGEISASVTLQVRFAIKPKGKP